MKEKYWRTSHRGETGGRYPLKEKPRRRSRRGETEKRYHGAVILEGICRWRCPGVAQTLQKGFHRRKPGASLEAPQRTQKASRDTRELARRPERSARQNGSELLSFTAKLT